MEGERDDWRAARGTHSTSSTSSTSSSSQFQPAGISCHRAISLFPFFLLLFFFCLSAVQLFCLFVFFFLFLSVFLLPPSLVFSYLVLVQFPKESSHPLQPSTLSFLSFFTFHSFILFRSRLACSLEGAAPMHLILFILSTLFQNP